MKSVKLNLLQELQPNHDSDSPPLNQTLRRTEIINQGNIFSFYARLRGLVIAE